MNLYDDKDAIIHRLRTHISILEQQNSTGYCSYEDTSSLTQQNISYSIDKTSHEDAAALEKLLQKREYELDQLREQLNHFQQESNEKFHRTIEQLNDVETKYQSIENERNELRKKLQNLQDENDSIKTYMNRLPSEIEYEKLRQSYEILQDQFKQSNRIIIDYRKEKIQLKKQLIHQQNAFIEEKKQTNLSVDKPLFNEKSLTKDERIERDEKYEEFRRIIQDLKEKLNEEIQNRKQNLYLNEKNMKIVQTLTENLEKKEQIIKELTNLLRQNRQELSDLRIRLVLNEEEQTNLNERLLSHQQFSLVLKRIHSTMEKLYLVFEYSSQMLNNQLHTSPDILMLQLSNHKSKSDLSSEEISTKIELSDVDKLEEKLDEIIDRLLSIRSELIARQFENDLQSTSPCRLQ